MSDLQQRSSHVSTDSSSSAGSRGSRVPSVVGNRKRDRFFQVSLVLSLIAMYFILYMVADVGEMPPAVPDAQTLAAVKVASKDVAASFQSRTPDPAILKSEPAEEQKEKVEDSVDSGSETGRKGWHPEWSVLEPVV